MRTYCARWLTPDQQLASKLQRLGYTELPGQTGELRRKPCTFRPRIELKRLVYFLVSLFTSLYFPEDWPTFVNQQVYPALVAILTAGRAYNFADPYILPKASVAPPLEVPSDVPTSSSADAITGADGAQSNSVSTKEVFEAIVRTTRNRSPTCTSFILVCILKTFVFTGNSSWCYVVPPVSDTLPLTPACIRSDGWPMLATQLPNGPFAPLRPCQLSYARL